MKCTFLYTALCCLIITACNNTVKEGQGDENASGNEATGAHVLPALPANYLLAVQAFREDKDKSMLKGIIEPEKVQEFKGLRYFEPDSSYALKAKIEMLSPEKVTFRTNDTRTPEYYKFCKLSFEYAGGKGVLTAYADKAEHPESLFIPFRDLTSGNETYGGGRYIDLHYNGEKTMILLDFNFAYNPYCHYNHNYSCPLVPAENVLKIPVRAGEKKLYE